MGFYIFLFAVATVGGAGFWAGLSVGRRQGYAQSKDELAAARAQAKSERDGKAAASAREFEAKQKAKELCHQVTRREGKLAKIRELTYTCDDDDDAREP